MSNTPTPHNEAKPGDFAKTVLMPGDPLRAKFIAEHFLKEVKQVNSVRGMLGYTGTYQGHPVSVMASGMGMPSIGIYSYELFHFYDVDTIIRVGSAGAISEDLKVKDIVLGMTACTNSNYEDQFALPGRYAPAASFSVLRTAVEVAEKQKLSVKVGALYSSDTFYDDTREGTEWRKMQDVLAVEMEAAALYMNAARAGKQALAICTISDIPSKGEALTAEERQVSFTEMMTLALETAILL